jgi:hypothetical protein
VANDPGATGAGFSVLRFAAVLRAARDFGLDQRTVNAIALRFDPRRPDVAHVADALADALLAHQSFDFLNSA